MHVGHSLNINNEMGPAGSRVLLSERNIGKALRIYASNELKPAIQCDNVTIVNAGSLVVLWKVEGL